MFEPLGRPLAAAALAVITGVGMTLALSPHLGSGSWVIGFVPALAVLIGVLRRPGTAG